MNKNFSPAALVAAIIVLFGSNLDASTDTSSHLEKSHLVGVGDTIPDVNVTDMQGRAIALRELAAKKLTVLIFYRGGWCPYCNTHLGKLQSIESEILASGYQIIAISPDRPAELRKSLEKHDLTYKLFSDSTMNAAKAFGLAFTVESATVVKYRLVGINLEKASGEKHYMLPVPAVFLVSTYGIIQFAYSNPDYKIRLKTDEILSAINRTIGK
jgi:peroxiredoxin